MSSDSIKYLLNEDRIPRDWYNLIADLPSPPPPVLHPGTHQPVGPDDLAPLFPMSLILQEVASERTIEIPNPVRDIYRQWRPTPLYRARRLEQALDTPARIYYKYEELVRLEATSQTQRWPKPFTIRKRASSALQRRPVRGNGVLH